MNERIGPITLDGETADRITLLNLKDYLESIQREMGEHATGKWLHPDDVTNNLRRIEIITELLKDFT
jgi:hypothetical protein